MKPEEAVNQIEQFMVIDDWSLVYLPDLHEALELAIEALKEMPVEGYRQRLMEVFHKTDHDELLTYVVMPKEEEFKSLEDILRQYKYEPRPHGEWVDEGFYAENASQHVYQCTHCKEHIVEYPSEMGSYCKYCGSDNRKRGEARGCCSKLE